MRNFIKEDFPVHNVRRFLEPGPIVLVSSSYREERTIMTMGWHLVNDDSKSLITAYVWDQNYSQELILKSRECVFNVPTAAIAETVVKIGNCSGRDVDKFRKFGLTAVKGDKVEAPMIKECYANFECRVHDVRMVKKYNLFIFEVVKAHVAKSPKFPETIHYRGDGLFMISGPTVRRYRRLFRPDMLDN